MKKQVDFKIRKKRQNRETGRFEKKTANDNFTMKKKTAKKKPMVWMQKIQNHPIGKCFLHYTKSRPYNFVTT